jgi:beta-galactosidase
MKIINIHIMKKITFSILFVWLSLSLWAARQPEFSTAGFFRLDNSGREVYSMNPAWRFHKGAVEGAETKEFNDKDWTVVSLPDGIEYLPTEASGCINYQGEVWYRKHFTPDAALKGKKLFLHFEAIMGKSKVFVNGKLLTEHFGGYLPVIADVTDVLDWNGDNVIAVWADNSDDPSYPPGKAQDVLDYTYFGGIYRDCWLIAHNNVFITDPNYENEVAGGGLFVAFGKVSDALAEVQLKIHVRNATKNPFSGRVEYMLLQPDGTEVARLSDKIQVKAGRATTVSDRMPVKQPMLWTPSTPTLYNLLVRVLDKEGNVIDGYRRRIGIRSIEFKGKDGFYLNGRPYGKPLIGANRHQDFAVVGNAVANSIHWRDAKKLKDVGMEIIRNAHCPQDPAFMDACDELGLFVIVNTPGWQFWNDAPEFAQRVYSDIRNVVRRDRNHPSVWLWEPILNETWYPADFAKNTRDIVDAEYPYPYCYSGSDSEARGHENFPVYFAHPANMQDASKEIDPTKTYFTREWGDNVDDWSSHNSPSRVARNWGEQPMRVQAQHYACPYYPVTSYDVLYKQSPQHVGGCLWHSFDHQRGYHPDPFYGGLMDVFRQPKYSYYMFMAQRPAVKNDRNAGSGPMVYIAHEMTPFSGKDVTVYSNCDEVRLTFNKGGKTYTYKKDKNRPGMPSPVITFPDVYDFMMDKAFSRTQKQDDVYLLAEGLIDGKVVATHKVVPARRPEKILLWMDNEGTDLKADGSDFVTVVAAVADKNGNIKRLNNYNIRFSIEGEGRLLGGPGVLANPVPVKWGTAPVLVQSTLKPGKIRITASVLFEGSQMPISGELEFESKPSVFPLVYDAADAARIPLGSASAGQNTASKTDAEREVERLRKELNTLKLKEVERQQSEFGEKE